MKIFFDLFPVILFFIAFKIYGIYIATAVAIVATFVQIGWVLLRRQKVEKILWINLVIILLLGGATLAFQDELFIIWKPTVLYWLFAVVLLVSNSFFRKNLLRAMLEKQMALPTAVWNKLNISWAAFFTFMGVINLYIAFSYSLDTWVNFKLFGSLGLMLAFVVIQGAILGKYLQHPEDANDITAPEIDNSPDESKIADVQLTSRKGNNK